MIRLLTTTAVLIVFLTSSCGSISQASMKGRAVECKPCDDAVLASIDRTSRLTRRDIRVFFCTLDSICSSAAEFSEGSNELLFELLLDYPEYCLNALDDPHFKSRVPFILDMIESPVNDLIDLREIHKRIEGVRSNTNNTKEAVLKALSLGIVKNH